MLEPLAGESRGGPGRIAQARTEQAAWQAIVRRLGGYEAPASEAAHGLVRAVDRNLGDPDESLDAAIYLGECAFFLAPGEVSAMFEPATDGNLFDQAGVGRADTAIADRLGGFHGRTAEAAYGIADGVGRSLGDPDESLNAAIYRGDHAFLRAPGGRRDV